VQTFAVFVCAALLEIAGCFAFWSWLRGVHGQLELPSLCYHCNSVVLGQQYVPNSDLNGTATPVSLIAFARGA
jgi:hypothetical protein